MALQFQALIRDQGMDVPMLIAFFDPTNLALEFVWSTSNATNTTSASPDVLARRLRIRDRTRAPGQPDFHVRPWNRGCGATRARTPGCSPKGWPKPSKQATQPTTRPSCCAAQLGPAPRITVPLSGAVKSPPPGTLCEVVPAGLSIAIAGMSWWTTDIGGFRGGDSRDGHYRTLLIRWFSTEPAAPLPASTAAGNHA